MPTSGDYSLYYHIPFCTKKCPYCHFFVLPDHEPSKNLLLKSLRQEFLIKNCSGNLKSIYFGGGTPSLFGPDRIKEVLSWSDLPSNSSIEITLEMNPEGVTLDKVKAYKAAGINRVSLGVQSFDEGQLIQLGRTHNAGTAEKAVMLIREAGIENLSIDLMYDLPSQTLNEWERTLLVSQKLPITHLSLYNLTVEPTSVFFKTKNEIESKMPDSDLSEQMYRMAQSYLTTAGLKQYEISAFAKPGFHSVHNTGYWLGRTFYGLGPSAFSYSNFERYRNVASLTKYAKKLTAGLSPVDFSEILKDEERERELFLIHLRLLQGAPLPSFKHELLPLEQAGLVKIEDSLCKLTARGILLYDSIGSELV